MIFPGALGDLICLGPALRAIRRSNPGGSLDLVARSELVNFAIGRMGVDGGFSLDRREIAGLFAESCSDDARDLFGGYDRIHSFFASDNEAFRRSLERVSRTEARFYPFRQQGRGHISACYLQAIGEPSEVLRNRVNLLDDELSAASSRLAQMGMAPGRYAALFPGSGAANKNWPLDRFVTLAEVLARQLVPVFILGPAESGIEAALRQSGFALLSGLDLPEVAALAAMAAVFVGNDSGVSHLAAATGAPGVVIFGPTEPARWRPLGKVEVIQRQPLEKLEVSEVAATAVKQIRCSLTLESE